MIFTEGFLKRYANLRNQDPSIYNLEELYYKVLPITLKADGSLWMGETSLEGEPKVTVNFPEFLDSTKNLAMLKSVHFAVDMSLNSPTELSENAGETARLVHAGKTLNSYFKTPKESLEAVTIPPLPESLYKLYIGYRHTPLRDINRHLKNTESVVTKQIAKMEDDCFNWEVVDFSKGLKLKTDRTSVLKFKVEIDIDELRVWINSVAPLDSREDFMKLLGDKEARFNLVLHPPYMGRMSFKNSLDILYPNRTMSLRLLDRVSFKTNRSYVENSKLYIIEFVDKESDQILFTFNTQDDGELFTNTKLPTVKNKEVNSYFDRDIATYRDSAVVDFSIPAPVQVALADHRNFKIRVRARDLTTHERG